MIDVHLIIQFIVILKKKKTLVTKVHGSCYTGNGTDYEGGAMYTENGFQCIPWSNVSSDFLNNSNNVMYDGECIFCFTFRRHLQLNDFSEFKIKTIYSKFKERNKLGMLYVNNCLTPTIVKDGAL